MSYYAAPKEEPSYCPVCNEEMGDDVRQLTCGCYAHKECQKDAPVCKTHGVAY